MQNNQLQSKMLITCKQLSKELDKDGDTHAAKVLETAILFLTQDNFVGRKYAQIAYELVKNIKQSLN